MKILMIENKEKLQNLKLERIISIIRINKKKKKELKEMKKIEKEEDKKIKDTMRNNNRDKIKEIIMSHKEEEDTDYMID